MMELPSSIVSLRPQSSPSAYEELNTEYTRSGFSYKANEILQNTAHTNARHYPYELLLQVTKTFHLNQFEVIFFSHVLTENEPCYPHEPEMFAEEVEIDSQVANSIERVLARQRRPPPVLQEEGSAKMEELEPLTHRDLRKIYAYLMVLGYAVKYYLNDQSTIKPYDQQVKSRHPGFFGGIFNRWAKKYGNSVLATTPKKINAYYIGMVADIEEENEDNCQYRNYNEIVEELIKATTEADEGADMNELDE